MIQKEIWHIKNSWFVFKHGGIWLENRVIRKWQKLMPSYITLGKCLWGRVEFEAESYCVAHHILHFLTMNLKDLILCEKALGWLPRTTEAVLYCATWRTTIVVVQVSIITLLVNWDQDGITTFGTTLVGTCVVVITHCIIACGAFVDIGGRTVSAANNITK